MKFGRNHSVHNFEILRISLLGKKFFLTMRKPLQDCWSSNQLEKALLKTTYLEKILDSLRIIAVAFSADSFYFFDLPSLASCLNIFKVHIWVLTKVNNGSQKIKKTLKKKIDIKHRCTFENRPEKILKQLKNIMSIMPKFKKQANKTLLYWTLCPQIKSSCWKSSILNNPLISSIKGFIPYRTENSMFSNGSWEIGDSYLISKLIITAYSRWEILNKVHYCRCFYICS